MSLKRQEPKTSPGIERIDSKKVKKTKPPICHAFLFHLDRPHTKYFQISQHYSLSDTNLIESEFIGLMIEEEKLIKIKNIPQKTLEKYLNGILEPKLEPDFFSDSDEEESEADVTKKEYTIQQLDDIRAKLIYDLREDRQSVADIAETLRISKEKVYYFYNKREEKILGIKSNEPKRFLITPQMYKELESYMNKIENSTATLRKMKEHLIQSFHLDQNRISLNTVSRMLRRLKFTRKRTSHLEPRRNLLRNLDARKKVALHFLSAEKSDLELIFIDESGFNNSLAPLYGYSKIGQKCFVAAKSKSVNYSVIAAVAKEKMLGFQIIKGGVTANCFGAFLCNLLKYNQTLLTNRSKYVLFMDNARIHRAKILQPFFQHMNVLYNVPYSPFLNPIEELFWNWKHIFREKFNQNTTNIIQRILTAAQEIDYSSLDMFYIHSLTFMNDCLNSKEIL